MRKLQFRHLFFYNLDVKLFTYFFFLKNINFYNTKNNLFFFASKKNFSYFLLLFSKFKNLELFNVFNFIWSKFVLFSGLGFKKKISRVLRYIYIYIGDRHWLVLPVPKHFFFFPSKRRNFIFFSFSKTQSYYFNNLLKELKKNSIFKVKGYLDVRTRRRWIFVRRLKLKRFKVKLSKKQKLI